MEIKHRKQPIYRKKMSNFYKTITAFIAIISFITGLSLNYLKYRDKQVIERHEAKEFINDQTTFNTQLMEKIEHLERKLDVR